MVTLTEKAAEKIKEFLAKEAQESPEIDYYLRVKVGGGGCSGFRYELQIDTSQKEDNVFSSHGVGVIVDPKSLPHLEGVEIDYVDDLTGSGFKFNNPNATGSCGCGESFQV